MLNINCIFVHHHFCKVWSEHAFHLIYPFDAEFRVTKTIPLPLHYHYFIGHW